MSPSGRAGFPKIADNNSVYADDGRKRTCRDISIDIRDCPKVETCAGAGSHPGEYASPLASFRGGHRLRFETRCGLGRAAADKVWGQIITAN
jgi:hypothetical protein